MNWISRTLGIVVLVGLMVAPSMAAVRFIGPRVVLAKRTFVGPAWYGVWGPRAYYPHSGPVYSLGPSTGEVKLDTQMRDATVFVDGGYVGPVNKFKKFELNAGNHDVEVRDLSGRTIFRERVRVLVDRTTEIRLPA